MTKIVIVDPISSGASLAEVFRERGAETFHVYQPELEAAFAADPVSAGQAQGSVALAAGLGAAARDRP
jgi:hypothetical protein